MVAEIKVKVEHVIGDGDEAIGNLELQSWRTGLMRGISALGG